MADETGGLEREVTLLGLCRLAVDWWKPLFVVGVLAALIAAIVLQLTPPKYEATSQILVTRTRSKDSMVGVDTTVIELDSYVAALERDDLLEEIMDRHHLREEPYKMNLDQFEGAVDISPLRNENSIRVRVELPAFEEQTPERVAAIANDFAEAADKISRDLLREDISRSMELFDKEFKETTEYLEATREAHREVKLTAPLREKEKEIENHHFYQRQLMTNYANHQAELAMKEKKLEELESLLLSEPRLLDVTRALEEEPSLLQVYSAEIQASTVEVYSATSRTQVVNDAYVKLREFRDQVRGDVVGLRDAVARLPKIIEDCNDRIREAELILNASEEAVEYWTNRLETAVLTHRAVDERHKLAALSISSDRQDLLPWWIRAYPPRETSGAPRAVLMLASAVFAMALFLFFLVFFEILRISIREPSRPASPSP